MKISIITVTLNNKAGLLRAIESVRSQTYKNVEHIIVDGGSTDGTVEAIKNEQFTMLNDQCSMCNIIFISEPDNGIYDAINKGIKLASGDVIGLLHSDDLYADENVLERYASAFNQLTTNHQPLTIDAVYSDLVYVRKKPDSVSEYQMTESATQYFTIRYWKTHKSMNSNQSSVNDKILTYKLN